MISKFKDKGQYVFFKGFIGKKSLTFVVMLEKKMQRPVQPILFSFRSCRGLFFQQCDSLTSPDSAILLNFLSHLLYSPLPHTQDRSGTSGEENDESNAEGRQQCV